jgi:hypothetical protein
MRAWRRLPVNLCRQVTTRGILLQLSRWRRALFLRRRNAAAESQTAQSSSVDGVVAACRDQMLVAAAFVQAGQCGDSLHEFLAFGRQASARRLPLVHWSASMTGMHLNCRPECSVRAVFRVNDLRAFI